MTIVSTKVDAERAAPPPARPPLPPVHELLRYGLPSMVGMMAFNVAHFVDMYWVGRIGAEAMAAVALIIGIQFVFSSVNGYVGAGSVALISQARGSGDLARTAEMIRQCFWAKFLIGSASGILGAILLPWMVGWFGVEPDVASMARTYGVWLLVFLGFSLAQFTCFTAFRCAGRPMLAMVLMLSAVVVNVVLDPILIFGWGPVPALGLAGAAIASVIASMVAMGWGVVLLARGAAGARVHFERLPLVDRPTAKTMARIGLPRGTQNLLRAVAHAVVIAFVARFGTVAVAAFGIADRMLTLGSNMSGGFGLGLAAMVGYELGAGRPENARRLTRRAVGIMMAILGALVASIVVGADLIARMIVSDPAVVAPTALAIRVVVLGVLPHAVVRVLDNAFQAGGYTLWPAIVHQGITWLVQIPLLAWIVYGAHGITALWWVLTGGAVAMMLGQLVLYRRGDWEA